MSGTVQPLPASLDHLDAGRLALSPWALADLLAAGVKGGWLSTSQRSDLGTDDASVASAKRELQRSGLLPLDMAGARRASELAFLVRGYAGAPGALGIFLNSDRGADRRGSPYTHLDVWPACTKSGELVIGQLLVDEDRSEALASVATPQAAAQDIVEHMLNRGHVAENAFRRGSATLTLLRGSVVAGVSARVKGAHIMAGEDFFHITGDKHGLRRGTAVMTVEETVDWLTRQIVETVS